MYKNFEYKKHKFFIKTEDDTFYVFVKLTDESFNDVFYYHVAIFAYTDINNVIVNIKENYDEYARMANRDFDVIFANYEYMKNLANKYML